MPNLHTTIQSVTKVDIALRKELRELAKATDEADRRNAIIRIDQMKRERFDKTKTRTFDRMINSLG